MSSEKLVEELRAENLCTYFVLPLLKLSKASFIKSNFVDCFITSSGKYLAIKIYNVSLLTRKVYAVPEYVKTVNIDGFMHVLFEIPHRWMDDVNLFRQGRFSRMSESAKSYIRDYSGLAYKQPKNEKRTETDGRLLALDRDPVLLRMWEKRLKVNLGDDDELLSKPGPESYIDYDPR